MGARLTDEQIEYILASPYSSAVVADETKITEGTVRYIRRKHGYKIMHNGYRPPPIDGEPVDLEAFDMPIPMMIMMVLLIRLMLSHLMRLKH